jgi:hypothetical protein
MLALSNKLFNMSQEWADFEKCANAALNWFHYIIL